MELALMEGGNMEEGSMEEGNMEEGNMEEERALMEEVDMEEDIMEEDIMEEDVTEPGLTCQEGKMFLTPETTVAANLRIQPSSRPSQVVMVEAMVVALEGATVLEDTAVRHMVEAMAVDVVATELSTYE